MKSSILLRFRPIWTTKFFSSKADCKIFPKLLWKPRGASPFRSKLKDTFIVEPREVLALS